MNAWVFMVNTLHLSRNGTESSWHPSAIEPTESARLAKDLGLKISEKGERCINERELDRRKIAHCRPLQPS